LFRLAASLSHPGFGDLALQTLCTSPSFAAQAALAKQRDFTEPFFLDDDSKSSIWGRWPRRAGSRSLAAGAFYHLMGAGQDKGLAVKRAVSFSATTQDKEFSPSARRQRERPSHAGER